MAKVNLTKLGNVVTVKNNVGRRFLNSIGAIFLGLAMAIICLIVLGWNEGRNVKTIRAYDEFGKNLIETGSAQVNPANDGKLVAIRGGLTFSPVTDSAYLITADSFVLVRRVEMYQWQEKRRGKSSDAEVTYTYTGAWSSLHIDSDRFYDNSYVNPRMPSDAEFQRNVEYATDAQLGEFRITPEQLSDLGMGFDLKVPESALLPSGFSRSADGKYIHNGNLSDPQVGNLRISFESNDITRASMLGRQQGNAIVSYVSKNGKRMDRMFSGERSGADMVAYIKAENKLITWFIRIFLSIFVCVGFSTLLSPVQLLLSLIPFLGKYLGKATQTIAQVIGTIVGVILSLLVIAISWIAVRPLVAIPLLLVVAGLIVLLNRYKKSKIDNAPQPALATADGGTVTAQQPAVEQPQSTGEQKKSFCSNCGGKIEEGAKFCPGCGKAV